MEKKVCYFLTAIGEDGCEIKERANTVVKYLLKPVCDKLNFELLRLDMLENTDIISEEMFEKLRNSDIVLADITEHQVNLFYQMAFRSALGLPIVHIREKGESLPFDIFDITVYEYVTNNLKEAANFQGILTELMNSFDESQNMEEDIASSEPDERYLLGEILDIVREIRDDIKEGDECLS